MSNSAASRFKAVGLPLLMALILSVGLAVTLQLQSLNQDIRQQASVDDQLDATPSADVTPAPSPTCVRAGCSGQLCVSSNQAGIVTTCEILPEYACYAQATCEPQANGNCGFTITPEVTTCLSEVTASPSPSISPPPPASPTPPPASPTPPPVVSFKMYWQFCRNPECTPEHSLDPVQRQLVYASENTATQRPTVYVGRSFGFPVVEFPGPVEIVNQYPPTVQYTDAINGIPGASLRYAQFDLRGQGFLQMTGDNYSFATPAATLTKIDEKMIALPRNTDTPAWFKGNYYQIVLQDLPNAVPYQFGSPLISQGIASIFMPNTEPPYLVYQYQASDINNDGQVNLIDFAYLRSELLKSKTYYDADLNSDNQVDLQDFSLFVQHLRTFFQMTTP